MTRLLRSRSWFRLVVLVDEVPVVAVDLAVAVRAVRVALDRVGRGVDPVDLAADRMVVRAGPVDRRAVDREDREVDAGRMRL